MKKYRVVANYGEYDVVEPIDTSLSKRENRCRKIKQEREVNVAAVYIGLIAGAMFLLSLFL